MTLLPLDQLRPLLARLREAETLAEALDDRERLGWTQLHICHVGGLLAADLRPMAALAHDVVAIAHDLGNRRMEAMPTCGRDAGRTRSVSIVVLSICF